MRWVGMSMALYALAWLDTRREDAISCVLYARAWIGERSHLVLVGFPCGLILAQSSLVLVEDPLEVKCATHMACVNQLERERERSTHGDRVLFSNVGPWEGFLGVKITRSPYLYQLDAPAGLFYGDPTLNQEPKP